MTVTLRIGSELWERCGWAAAARNVNRSDFVRNTLANATRDALPPIPREFKGVSGSPEELAAWQRSAEMHGHRSLEDWTREVLTFVAKRDGVIE